MQILVELPYWPPVSWLALAWHSDTLWLEACENFQKSSFRNRCHIAGPNGLQRLSIPLEKGKNQQTPIRDVRIFNQDPWQTQHWRSITAAYGNAPFFDHMADSLHFFYKKQYRFLFDLNLEILEFVFNQLNWPGTHQLTNSYEKTPPAPAMDFRNTVSPGGTTPPPWFSPAAYPQVFLERHGFLPDLSALDLLLCCGNQASSVVAKSALPETF